MSDKKQAIKDRQNCSRFIRFFHLPLVETLYEDDQAMGENFEKELTAAPFGIGLPLTLPAPDDEAETI